ncbi:HEPN domain-containing protein [uncultured Sphaerochaeta sp.]|uniref:HEPN domain-containing protein n=1 Tax=uncultured Sphaerochaeta sp. TaxID=886478 RepID=UPI002A0A7DB3|nr:MAE_28990/MAE_18760 family HEPN-like nuclease [uncultured Sphaerochaeta sp.]
MRCWFDCYEVGADTAEDKDTVFLRSAYVLLSSAWERFIEDIIIAGTRFIVETVDAKDVPKALKKKICKNIQNDKNELSAWSLVGDNWKNKVLECIEEQIRALNSPKSMKIDEIFNDVFGIKITESWHWRYEVEENKYADFSVENVKNLIDEFVSARGAIAHGREAQHPQSFYLNYIRQLIGKVASLINNELCNHLEKMTGKAPWEKVSYNVDWKPYLIKEE